MYYKNDDNQLNKGRGKMIKKFLKYGIPSSFAMFISSLYTVLDGIFIGKGIGDEALAGVNLVLPITLMIFGVATLFAMGGGALISKNFGVGKSYKALHIFRQTIELLIIMSFLVSLIGMLFREQIVSSFGATVEISNIASEYLGYYALFCIPNVIAVALDSFVRNDGKPRLAMFGTIMGSLTNILLDYLFIFHLHMGVKGGAIGTGLGQIVTVIILSMHFYRHKGKLSFGYTRIEGKDMRTVIKIGMPSLFAECAFAIIIFFQNMAMVKYIGDNGLAAFSIVNYITTTIYLTLLGLGFGIQPLVSYNYGAKNVYRILKIYKLANLTAFILNVGYSSICFVYGREIISIFTQNPTIIEMTYSGLNVTNLAFFILGANLMMTVYYQAIQVPGYSNFICIARALIFLPIAVVFLGKYFGLNGIWISLLVSETLTLLTMYMGANVKVRTRQLMMLPLRK